MGTNSAAGYRSWESNRAIWLSMHFCWHRRQIVVVTYSWSTPLDLAVADRCPSNASLTGKHNYTCTCTEECSDIVVGFWRCYLVCSQPWRPQDSPFLSVVMDCVMYMFCAAPVNPLRECLHRSNCASWHAIEMTLVLVHRLPYSPKSTHQTGDSNSTEMWKKGVSAIWYFLLTRFLAPKIYFLMVYKKQNFCMN